MSGDEMATGGVGGVSGTSRRSPKQGIGGSPVGSTLSIVFAVCAVVIGFLILNNITSESSSATGGASDPGIVDVQPTTTIDVGITTTIPIATTTTVPVVTEGAVVVVANGNTIGGSAGRMTETLAGAGYNMGSPTNASSNVEDSIVYFDPVNAAAQAVAESVARSLGGVSVQPVGTPPPTQSGSLDGAGVLVVLGNAQADKTLETLAAEAGLATPDLGTAPAVAGDVVAPAPVETDPAG